MNDTNSGDTDAPEGVVATQVIDGRTLVVKRAVFARQDFYEGPGYDVFDGDQRLTLVDPYGGCGDTQPTVAQLRVLISARGQVLQRLMVRRRIVAGNDYQYEDVYEIAHSEGPIPRYVAVTYDETYSFLDLYETFEDAALSVAGSLGRDTGGSPAGVYDLDEDRMIRLRFRTIAYEIGGQRRVAEPGPVPLRFEVRSAASLSHYSYETEEQALAKQAELNAAGGHDWNLVVVVVVVVVVVAGDDETAPTRAERVGYRVAIYRDPNTGDMRFDITAPGDYADTIAIDVDDERVH